MNNEDRSSAFKSMMDSMFGAFISEHNIPSFTSFCEEYEAKQRIERANEFKAFDIVKEILSSELNTKRLFLNFARRHSSVLLDNKVAKSICRFYVSYVKTGRKYITIRDRTGKNEKIFINDIEDIYLYADKLKDALNTLIIYQEKSPAPAPAATA